ncbi:MAG: GAF domain-containing protein [Sphingomicrobium sp.]
MPFALQLRELLGLRERLMPAEFAKGEPLESVLDRYLMVVESTAESDTITSILLLDGTTLHHGAGPKLPRGYRKAIDGAQIGPTAGSCGTAAFFGHPVYVSDIANDPLWQDYRDLALGHGLRACWSTPIRNTEDRLLGTFAVYHQRPRDPTKEELDAIRTITDHVARAIMFYRGSHYETDEPQPARPALRLVHDSDAK